MKRILAIVLILALAVGLGVTAFAAANPAPAVFTASGTTIAVTVSGTFAAGSNVTAAAVEVRDSGNNLVAFKTFAVTGNAFSGTITGVTLTIGAAYTAKAANYDGGEWKTVTFTVTVPTAPASPASNYTLTFETNGGDKLTAVSASAGEKIDLSKYFPVRKGYSFAGWYSDEALTKAVTYVTLTKNTKVYAGWIWTNPYADVATGSYCYDAVRWASEKGVTDGKTDTLFAPDDTCTRAEALTFLWRAMSSPEPTAATCPFADVKADAYYYKAVLWAVEKGITDGTSAATFSPNDTCTRAQVVTFQWRAAGSPAAPTANPFTDVASGLYYIDAVLWAVSSKITDGTTATTFSPAQNCSRAQIVTFLWRQLGK